MMVHANENDRSITLTVDCRHRSTSLGDAEDLLDELEEAAESAKEKID